MNRQGLLLAGAALLAWSRAATAEDAATQPQAPPDEGDDPARAFNQIRMLLSGSTFSGRSLVGTGSVGRYRLGGASLELEAERVFGVAGFFVDVGGFYIPDSDELGYVRGEGGAAFGVASWQGAAPGSVLLAAGIGGDYGRYWYAEDGRFYGLASARLRLWPSRDVPLQLAYTAIPAAFTAIDGHHHEHRVELATGWSLLTFGSRLGFAFTSGGEPHRTFSQVEIGTFVGVGLYE
ncbi:MAG: hypothetical protein JNL21_09925 [Myxococcales bacterium]|nr:hypothetical protein [Myxococcales bacterium]